MMNIMFMMNMCKVCWDNFAGDVRRLWLEFKPVVISKFHEQRQAEQLKQ
jgi:hypothetical protein